MVRMVAHVFKFIPQTILIWHAVSSIAFISGHVGVRRHVSTIIVVMIVVTLVAGNGHIIPVLVDRIAGGGHILVIIGARGRVDNINLSDTDVSLCVGGGTWAAVAFVTFVGAGGNAKWGF